MSTRRPSRRARHVHLLTHPPSTPGSGRPRIRAGGGRTRTVVARLVWPLRLAPPPTAHVFRGRAHQPLRPPPAIRSPRSPIPAMAPAPSDHKVPSSTDAGARRPFRPHQQPPSPPPSPLSSNPPRRRLAVQFLPLLPPRLTHATKFRRLWIPPQNPAENPGESRGDRQRRACYSLLAGSRRGFSRGRRLPPAVVPGSGWSRGRQPCSAMAEARRYAIAPLLGERTEALFRPQTPDSPDQGDAVGGWVNASVLVLISLATLAFWGVRFLLLSLGLDGRREWWLVASLGSGRVRLIVTREWGGGHGRVLLCGVSVFWRRIFSTLLLCEFSCTCVKLVCVWVWIQVTSTVALTRS